MSWILWGLDVRQEGWGAKSDLKLTPNVGGVGPAVPSCTVPYQPCQTSDFAYPQWAMSIAASAISQTSKFKGRFTSAIDWWVLSLIDQMRIWFPWTLGYLWLSLTKLTFLFLPFLGIHQHGAGGSPTVAWLCPMPRYCEAARDLFLHYEKLAYIK